MTLNALPIWDSCYAWPEWMRAALTADVDPWTGGYSAVYPLGADEVVKLVWEPGAVAYLQMCQGAKASIPNLPRVHEILPWATTLRETGQGYCAVRMERLRSGGTEMERYSKRYAHYVEEHGHDIRCSVQLSRVSAVAVARELPRNERSLASCLLFLADELQEKDWILDLANSDNWMLRQDGTVVLCDPVHSARFFPDDLA